LSIWATDPVGEVHYVEGQQDLTKIVEELDSVTEATGERLD
jgi:hypothetical protein